MSGTWASGAGRPPLRPPPTTTTVGVPPATALSAHGRIDPNIRAGQWGGVGCREPADDASDLFWRKGILADPRFPAHLGGNAGGTDRVDANSQGAALNSQGLSQTGQSRLRRHVSGHLRKLIGPGDAGQA